MDSVLRPGDPQNATVTQLVMSKSREAIENARDAFRRREVPQKHVGLHLRPASLG